MSGAVELNGDAVGIGRGALRALRQALLQDLGEQGAVRLQEVGHAAGSDVYACFLRWLKTETGVTDPGALDATKFGSVLGDFFEALGWGRVAVSRVGSGGGSCRARSRRTRRASPRPSGARWDSGSSRPTT